MTTRADRDPAFAVADEREAVTVPGEVEASLDDAPILAPDDAPHPFYTKSLMLAVQIGRKDPVGAVRLTVRSILQHIRDLASLYDTLLTGKGRKGEQVHGKMRELFLAKQEAVGKELHWLDRSVTLAWGAPKEVLPVLARFGEERAMRQRAVPWHTLALTELGFSHREGATLLRLGTNTYGKWVEKAKQAKDKRTNIQYTPVKPDIPVTPRNGGKQDRADDTGTETEVLLNDPVRRLAWSVEEMLNAARDEELDARVRFQFLSALEDGAQREAAKETQRVAESAIALSERLIPHLVDALEQAMELWRQDLEAKAKHLAIEPFSVREEVKKAILNFEPFSKEVEKKLALL